MQHAAVFVSEEVTAELRSRFTGLSEAQVRQYVDRAASDLLGSVATDEAFPEMVVRLAAHRIGQDGRRRRTHLQAVT